MVHDALGMGMVDIGGSGVRVEREGRKGTYFRACASKDSSNYYGLGIGAKVHPNVMDIISNTLHLLESATCLNR